MAESIRRTKGKADDSDIDKHAKIRKDKKGKKGKKGKGSF